MGETVSLFGSQLTLLALPLTAVVLLHATPGDMGRLNAAGFAPFVLLTCFAGVWLDKRRKRSVLVVCNIARALLLMLIPLGYFAGVLRIEHMMLIVFLVGVFNITFELAYQSYLPTLLYADQLVEGNSKLFASSSLAEIGGPGLAGVVMDVFSAPLAIVLDALSFLVAGFSLLRIRQVEPEPLPSPTQSVWRSIWEGLRLTFRNRYLRLFCFEATTYNFFNQASATLFVLYATRELGLTAGTIGLLFAVGSVGALIGSLTTARVAHIIGLGVTISMGALLSCVAPLLIPLAPRANPMPFLMIGFFVSGLGVTITNVHVFSIRQSIMPADKRGRLIASYRFVSWGVIPFGAFLSGALAERIGLQPTLLIGACGLMTACFWFILSPISRLCQPPPMMDTFQSNGGVATRLAEEQ